MIIVLFMEGVSFETVVQQWVHRCPYCEEPISYDQIPLAPGENRISCPSCKKVFIKIVSATPEEGEIP